MSIIMSIYIIRHKESDNSYIGRCKDFQQMKEYHRKEYHNYPKYRKLYDFVRDNGGWDNFDMVEICKCDIEIASVTEQYHIHLNKPSLNNLNKIREFDIKDYYKKKTRHNEFKEYRQKNKEKIEEMNCIYECECGGYYTKRHKARHFKYPYHLSHCPTPHSPRQN